MADPDHTSLGERIYRLRLSIENSIALRDTYALAGSLGQASECAKTIASEERELALLLQRADQPMLVSGARERRPSGS